MDRPPPRRGRHGTNSDAVSVADLLARTTPAEQASVSAIHQRAAAEAAAAAVAAEEEARNQAAATTNRLPVVAAPAEVTDEPPGASRLAKTIVAVIAVMLIGGGATAASVLASQHAPRISPGAPSVGPNTIAGPTVMRPDLLNSQLRAGLLTTGRTADGSRPAALLGSSRSAGSLHPEDEERAQRLLDPALAAVRPGDSAGTQAAQARKVVRDFYELLEASPADAYLMLGPEMRGDGAASFVRGWEPLIVELPQLEGGEGGVVRAVVAVAWQDATVLRTEQLLVVSDGPEPKIIRAALLSAHRG